LGWSQKEVVERMDVEEIRGWLAYEIASNPEHNKALSKKIELERQEKLSPEELSKLAKLAFAGNITNGSK
jgi:chromosome segregation and condensation protein ScpB